VVFSDQEWGLLVGLPQAVAVAASAAEADGIRATIAESQAGLDAISAGRESGIPLVQDIAQELVSRVGDPEDGEQAPLIELPNRETAVADVLARARAAAVLLAEKADEGEAGAYKHWLVNIAEQVVAAASSGGVLGVGGDLVSESEQRFVDRLSKTLND